MVTRTDFLKIKWRISQIYTNIINITSPIQTLSITKNTNFDYCETIITNINRKEKLLQIFNVKEPVSYQTSNVDETLSSELESFYNTQYEVTENTDVLLYWRTLEGTYPRLYKLSNIILSIPCTQASVERTFSTLKFIYSDLRNSLNKEILEKLLFVKLNNKELNE